MRHLPYQDTVRRMGIDPTKICRNSTSFKGVTPGLFSQSHRLCTTRGLVRFIRQPPSRKAHPPSPHLAVALKHYWGVQLSPALMQYHITRLLRLKMPGPRGIFLKLQVSLDHEECAAA